MSLKQTLICICTTYEGKLERRLLSTSQHCPLHYVGGTVALTTRLVIVINVPTAKYPFVDTDHKHVLICCIWWRIKSGCGTKTLQMHIDVDYTGNAECEKNLCPIPQITFFTHRTT